MQLVSRLHETTTASRGKVLFVLGPTGTGKSKLAVHLALHVDGEVVNADAMQLYQGLDIATAKVGTQLRKHSHRRG